MHTEDRKDNQRKVTARVLKKKEKNTTKPHKKPQLYVLILISNYVFILNCKGKHVEELSPFKNLPIT